MRGYCKVKQDGSFFLSFLLPPDAAKSETVATIVGILRVDTGAIEVQDVSTRTRVSGTRPVEAVRPLIAERTIGITVGASVDKIEGRLLEFGRANFLRTGLYDRSNGFIGVRVAYGYWWSSAAGSGAAGHFLHTYPTGVRPQDNYSRGSGFAVRCVVREG